MIAVEIILAVLTLVASISGAIAVRRTLCACSCNDVNIHTEPKEEEEKEHE